MCVTLFGLFFTFAHTRHWCDIFIPSAFFHCCYCVWFFVDMYAWHNTISQITHNNTKTRSDRSGKINYKCSAYFSWRRTTRERNRTLYWETFTLTYFNIQIISYLFFSHFFFQFHFSFTIKTEINYEIFRYIFAKSPSNIEARKKIWSKNK